MTPNLRTSNISTCNNFSLRLVLVLHWIVVPGAVLQSLLYYYTHNYYLVYIPFNMLYSQHYNNIHSDDQDYNWTNCNCNANKYPDIKLSYIRSEHTKSTKFVKVHLACYTYLDRLLWFLYLYDSANILLLHWNLSHDQVKPKRERHYAIYCSQVLWMSHFELLISECYLQQSCYYNLCLLGHQSQHLMYSVAQDTQH